MAFAEFVRDSVFVSPAEWDAESVVVWLRGEHDLSTIPALSESLAQVTALDDDNLILDLSEVLFMDASTVGVIIRAREVLRRQSRSLVLRSPSRCASFVLDLCGLSDLIVPPPVDDTPMWGSAVALESWVAVPKVDRVGQPAGTPLRSPNETPEPVRVGLVPTKDLVA